MQKGESGRVGSGGAQSQSASCKGTGVSSTGQSKQFVSMTSGASVRIHVDSVSLSLPANCQKNS
jgi:hypothetical protein